MKSFFGPDSRRIAHALKVLEFAEEIIRGESPADADVVIASAIFHDIGIKEGERLHNSNAPKYQEQYGPPIARKILSNHELDSGFINDVCDIIAHHHHPKRYEETFPDKSPLPFRILVDADLIVNALESDVSLQSDSPFHTKSAKSIAARECCIRRTA